MVYTVTFNPAIDYIVHTAEMKLGATNRSDREEMYFGGKGINVSIVLRELGIDSKALGFTAGFTGEAIEKGLADMGIDADFVRLDNGNSRINVKIKATEETELNGQGPDIDDKAISALYEKLDKLSDGDTLILAGSIPSSLPSDIYQRILERLSCKKIKAVVDATKDLCDEWRRLTIYRLILVCEAVSAKYTRSRVRKRIPKDMVYILDELLNVTDDVVKEYYYDEIITTILDTGIADRFIKSICELIQSLAIDKLHIIGDIYDRGPRADIIMDELMRMHDVDIEWGNHDISWIGAASGNWALIANVIRISMRYNNFDVLEDGYGLNLRALAVFAGETYKDDDCELFMPQTLDDNIYDPVDTKLVAKMHKAITVIQLKLEGQLIERHPEWNMDERDIFRMVDFDNGTVTLGGRKYTLLDTNFPTVFRDYPLSLTDEENELMTVLANSFMHSERLNSHIRFLYSKGSMYKTINGNLLFHGCIPLDKNGYLQSVNIAGRQYSGKALLDKLDEIANKAYFMPAGAEKDYAADYMWYLWSGACSPLYGKDKMAFFERYFLDDEELQKENYNAYYHYSEQAAVCGRILEMFGLDPKHGHIINGHVPVKIKNGENPVKADGRLFVIDGGITKAYQKATGIAGYTLIYDSHSLNLAEHKPFIAGESEHTPEIHQVEKLHRRANISDTDKGAELLEQINDLRELLTAYRSGEIKESGRN